MAEVPDTVDDAIAELSDTPTTDEVFFKTLPFQGREVASAAVSMAAAGGGGATPDLAAVLAEGGDPDDNPITGTLYIDNPDASTAALTVDGGLFSGGTSGQIALFRKSNGELVGYIGAVSGSYAPGVDKPTLELSKDQLVVNIDPDIGGQFLVSDIDGNTLVGVYATGAVQLQPPPGSLDNPLVLRLESGTVAFVVATDGTVFLGPSGAYMSPGGALVIEQHSAPSDVSLGAGECAIWFDQTNGASKLMIKAKSANGTVVTGNVPLT